MKGLGIAQRFPSIAHNPEAVVGQKGIRKAKSESTTELWLIAYS